MRLCVYQPCVHIMLCNVVPVETRYGMIFLLLLSLITSPPLPHLHTHSVTHHLSPSPPSPHTLWHSSPLPLSPISTHRTGNQGNSRYCRLPKGGRSPPVPPLPAGKPRPCGRALPMGRGGGVQPRGTRVRPAGQTEDEGKLSPNR